MKKTENNRQAFYEIRPADKPYAKIIIPEKRSGLNAAARFTPLLLMTNAAA